MRAQLGRTVDAYVDGGPCRAGLESTIIGWIDERATLLRAGGLDPRQIEAVIGPLERLPVELQAKAGSVNAAVLAPGMLRRHHSPRTYFAIEGEGAPAGKDVGDSFVP